MPGAERSNDREPIYIAVGAIVRDRWLDREGGRVGRVRSDWVDVEWPCGTLTTYSSSRAREDLEVMVRPLSDIFGLGRVF